jgi:hypothetical protein
LANDTGTKTPIEPGVIARITQGVRWALSGKDPTTFFGPGQPLQPQAQEVARGRQFDFPVGFNQVPTPRSTEGVTFAQMRNLADGYDLLRLVIETRKDQVEALEWSVKPKDEKAKPDDRCKQVADLLASPDKEHPWSLWLRMLLEEVFVIDAPAIYPRMTRGGGVYSLDLVDGATIKRVLDLQGRTPVPPDPAYQQILKGLPAVDYSRDELIYMPRNPRVNRVYGYSPVEQIIMTVNIALRRQISQLQYYTEGNIPEALIGVPEDWTPDQIKQFQEYWDSLLEGNTAARRHAKFVPGGMEPTFTRGEGGGLKDEMDEWLARIVCFAFSVNPTPFIKQQNRATADNAAEQAWTEGLVPLMKYLKGVFDLIVQKFLGFDDLQFAWTDSEEVDPLTRAEIDKIYLDGKVLHPDEVREGLGKDPLTAEQKADMTPPAPVGPDGKPLAPGAPGAKPGAKPAATDASKKLDKKKDTLSRLTATAALSRRLARSSARY